MHLHDAIIACHLHARVDIRHGARTDVTVAASTVDPAVSQFPARYNEWHRTRTAAEWGKYGAYTEWGKCGAPRNGVRYIG